MDERAAAIGVAGPIAGRFCPEDGGDTGCRKGEMVQHLRKRRELQPDARAAEPVRVRVEAEQKFPKDDAANGGADQRHQAAAIVRRGCAKQCQTDDRQAGDDVEDRIGGAANGDDAAEQRGS